ncbi:MAG: hypothetical protein M3472_05000, partial [Chloroflexota bacterium]|nr:hypothetical protein [Chloroflexota bacterium]
MRDQGAATSTRRIRVLWNANAGSKGGVPTDRTGEPELRALMTRHGLGDDLVASASEEEAIEATRDARDNGYDAVVAAGGDGTVRLAATHLLQSETSLGILPMGSVMNIARMLGISRQLEPAAATIAAGLTRRIDVGTCGEEPFFESGSVGMNAAIFKQVQQADEGDYRGIARALRTAFRYGPARMYVELDDRTFRTRALMITVS